MIAGLLLLASLAQSPAQSQPVSGGPYTILARPEQQELAQRLLEVALGMAPFPGLPPDAAGQVRIDLAADEAHFAALTGGRAPDWGAGIAYPDSGVIVLPAYASPRGNMGDLPSVLRHEVAHIALHRFVHPAAVPRWVSEGYATWAAGQLDFEAGWMLRLAFVTGTAPPLDSIVLGWPRSAAGARVAYLLSASAIDWLHDRGGDRSLGILFERWKDSGFEPALRQTYGLTTGQLERHWGRSVRRRYGWLLFFAQASVAWAILSIFVVALYLIRRRRDRLRLADLQRREPPDRPAFWLGEVDLDPPAPEPKHETEDGQSESTMLDGPGDAPRSSAHHDT